MGEESRERRMQKQVGILKRCQEIGNATGMCSLLCMSLCLNVVMICILAKGMHNSSVVWPQFFLCNNFVQREFGVWSRRNFANSVRENCLTRHVHWVHANHGGCCSATPIRMCYMWQMRANADAAIAAAICVRKAVIASKVGAMASSQVCSCVQEGLITPTANIAQAGGSKPTKIAVRRDSVDVLFEEKLRLLRKGNHAVFH